MCGFAVYTGSDMMDKLLFASEFKKFEYRGPDNSIIRDFGKEGWMGFHRLSIMDVSSNGNQPLIYKHINLVCNGEVYNFQQLRKQYEHKFEFKSTSDCEVIIPLFLDKGIEETAKTLDAEFVFVIYDSVAKKYFAARDPIGIRPLFYGYSAAGEIMFSSEMKTLHPVCKDVKPFPPGHYFDGENFICYKDISKVDEFVHQIWVEMEWRQTQQDFECFSRTHALFVDAVCR